MVNPSISVIIPVYNAGKFLAETLEAIRNQTFNDFEVICVNDGLFCGRFIQEKQNCCVFCMESVKNKEDVR